MIDQEHIVAIGHSLGGFTVMLLGGARFNPKQFARDCKVHAALASCQVWRLLQAGKTQEDQSALALAQRDPRIKAVVSLDLGLARGFTRESLRALPVPAFIIAAGAPNPSLPAALESHAMWKKLPAHTAYLEIPDATHFSFLQSCQPDAKHLLREGPPEDRDICQDAQGARRRSDIHEQIVLAILQFLAPIFNTPQTSS